MLKHLNEVNDVKIRSVKDPEFAPFGRVVTGYDFSGLISYMESSTEIRRAEIFTMPPSRDWRQIRSKRRWRTVCTAAWKWKSATATDATPPTTV